jgi:hypothetical protein
LGARKGMHAAAKILSTPEKRPLFHAGFGGMAKENSTFAVQNQIFILGILIGYSTASR